MYLSQSLFISLLVFPKFVTLVLTTLNYKQFQAQCSYEPFLVANSEIFKKKTVVGNFKDEQLLAKTCLPPSMLSSSSKVRVQGCSASQIFSKQQMLLFALSSCCSCHVFSYYFAQFLLLNRVKCPPFLFSQPKQLKSSRLTVH